MANPLAIGTAFLAMTARLMSDPSRLVQAQLSLWNDHLTLCQHITQRFLGGATEPVIEPSAGDRRFRDVAWTDNTIFDFIKQRYLLKARWLQNAVRDVQSIDQHTARKIDFYTGQFVDAIAPSNFLVTNPEVLRETITYFVTMVDFADAGELSVFIDEEQLSALEERMNAKGYLEGRDRPSKCCAPMILSGLASSTTTCSEGRLFLRSVVLECGFLRSCRRPCTASTCATVSRELACQTGRDQPRRCADRLTQDQDPVLPVVDP